MAGFLFQPWVCAWNFRRSQVKKIIFGVLLMLSAFLLSSCTEGFPDEEMHFGIEDKVRPYAVIIEPPEAAPGDVVEVTFLARVPDQSDLDITWKVALDFSNGIYETDEVEDNFVSPNVPLAVVDADGFLTQTFTWQIPDDALLLSSDIPEVLVDPATVFLAEELLGSAGRPVPTKGDVNSWLSNLTDNDVDNMSEEKRLATWALADRFASQIRFRCALQTERAIDVTRNLTIRHTARLNGPNANINPHLQFFEVVALEVEDAVESDLFNPEIPQTVYPFFRSGSLLSRDVQVPLHENWTYYLNVSFTIQNYTPPFDPYLTVAEARSHRWYYYRQDDPRSEHQFLVTEDGDETEMFNLEETVRIMPDGVGSTFRVVTVGRDPRFEWVSYNAVPGLVAEEGTVEFVEP